MNVYTCTDFEGHYPVGTAAVIVAETMKDAKRQLRAELQDRGLGKDEDFTLKRVYTAAPKVVILDDGDY